MNIQYADGEISMKSMQSKKKPLYIKFTVNQIQSVKESLFKQIYCATSRNFQFVARILCKKGWDSLVLLLVYYMQQNATLPQLSETDIWQVYDTILEGNQAFPFPQLEIPSKILKRLGQNSDTASTGSSASLLLNFLNFIVFEKNVTMAKKCIIEHSLFYDVKSFLKQIKNQKLTVALVQNFEKWAGDTQKLDMQITEFCEKLEVTPDLIEGVKRLQEDIEAFLKSAVQNIPESKRTTFRLLKYGNLVNGLFSKLDTSISFTVVTDSTIGHRDLLELIRASAIKDSNRRSLARLQIQARKQGQLLQFFDLDLNINVKIRVNKKSSISNALVILQYCRASKTFKNLAHILKEWNFEKKESRRKNRGNLQLHLLLAAYMQRMKILPEIQRVGSNQTFNESTTYSPGQVLISFFQFFAFIHQRPDHINQALTVPDPFCQVDISVEKFISQSLLDSFKKEIKNIQKTGMIELN